MDQKMQSGYLMLADISGYTSFVAQTEIEHANQAISLLLEAIIEKLGNRLTVSKLEGDAVFLYADDSQFPDGKILPELIDHTYLAFREKANALHLQSTCPCKACRAIPTLDLKFMVHYGDYIIQQVAGIKDLLGTDVNLIHRLLKNHVAESTGWKGYALFTGRGLEHMQIGKDLFVKQAESYEHLGEVETYIIDMRARYDQMRHPG